MRRLLAILALAACLPFAGCDKDEEWLPLGLGQISVTIPPTEETSIRVGGGSGNYSVEIDDPTIAEVSVEPAYGGGYMIVIEPLKEGSATITVTDNKSGEAVTCPLIVTKYTTSFKIADIEWSIDADNPEAIETALKADTSVPPVGGAILLSTWNSPPELAFAGADGKEFAHGVLKRENLTEINPIFSPFLPTQIISDEKWILLYDAGGEREFEMYVMNKPQTRLNMPPLQNYQERFMEDLTGYYQAEFPDAGVRSVARVLISNGAN